MIQFTRTIKNFIKVICVSLTVIFLSDSALMPVTEENGQKEYLVYMVLWRGVTDAEKGFMDYFKTHKIPARFIIKDCKNDKKKLPAILNDIRKTRPDLIYTFGTTATKFIAGSAGDHTADKNILDIPIIFNIVAKPVESGLVDIPELDRNIDAADFEKRILKKIDNRPDRDFIQAVYIKAKNKKMFSLKDRLSNDEKDRLFDILIHIDAVSMVTGRNLTGCMHLVPLETQMNSMKSVMDISKIGVLYNPAEDNAIKQVNELESYCRENNIAMLRSPVALDDEKKPLISGISSSVKLLADGKVNIIYLPSDSFIIANAAVIMTEINQYRIVTFSATEDPIRKGGALMGLVSHYYNVGLFAGFKAEKILVNKVKAGDIPIETLKRFSFLVNMETAGKINFYPPIMILKFAEIIKETEVPVKAGRR
jgi:ABC-type uncharacterized transport system substrate-binding protein